METELTILFRLTSNIVMIELSMNMIAVLIDLHLHETCGHLSAPFDTQSLICISWVDNDHAAVNQIELHCLRFVDNAAHH